MFYFIFFIKTNNIVFVATKKLCKNPIHFELYDTIILNIISRLFQLNKLLI